MPARCVFGLFCPCASSLCVKVTTCDIGPTSAIKSSGTTVSLSSSTHVHSLQHRCRIALGGCLLETLSEQRIIRCMVRYLTSDCVFSTVVHVVVLNSCVDRLGFVVVGEWRDRGTTEAIVLVVFCLPFFGTNLAVHARYKWQSQLAVLMICSTGTRCQAPRRHHLF